jgi:hypothetical protein
MDFKAINRAALAALPVLVERWLPGGRRRKNEYIARNPTRHDTHVGSFCINLRTGKWADFALSKVSGSDPISLFAYLRGIKQGKAAYELAQMLGVRS